MWHVWRTVFFTKCLDMIHPAVKEIVLSRGLCVLYTMCISFDVMVNMLSWTLFIHWLLSGVLEPVHTLVYLHPVTVDTFASDMCAVIVILRCHITCKCDLWSILLKLCRHQSNSRQFFDFGWAIEEASSIQILQIPASHVSAVCFRDVRIANFSASGVESAQILTIRVQLRSLLWRHLWM